MLISCPGCAAGYEVPNQMLAGAGRKVRCARCAVEFQATLPEPEAPPVPPALSILFDKPVPLASPARRARGGGIWVAAAAAGWVLSAVLLCGMGWAAVRFRGEVIAHWPPSERLYQAIGLNAPASAPQAASASPPV